MAGILLAVAQVREQFARHAVAAQARRVLDQHCRDCHNPGRKEGDVDIFDRQALLDPQRGIVVEQRRSIRCSSSTSWMGTCPGTKRKSACRACRRKKSAF